MCLPAGGRIVPLMAFDIAIVVAWRTGLPQGMSEGRSSSSSASVKRAGSEVVAWERMISARVESALLPSSSDRVAPRWDRLRDTSCRHYYPYHMWLVCWPLITSKLNSLSSWNLKDKADLKRASLIGPWQGWVLLNQEVANKKPVKL